jgi:hypothetical protein
MFETAQDALLVAHISATIINLSTLTLVVGQGAFIAY